MLKILIKLVLSGSVLVGVSSFRKGLSLDASKETQERESIKKKRAEAIKKFEDIGIYAKEHGCSFAFASKRHEKQVYSPEKFVDSEQSKPTGFDSKTIQINTWKQKMVDAVELSKSLCKEDRTLTFFYKDGDVGTFKISTPP